MLGVLPLIGLLLLTLGAPIGARDDRTAVLLDLNGPIGPALGDYVGRGLAKARDRNAAVVVLRIDTPGGLDASMREIVQDILASPIPVVGYVAPSGARAASAGTYILYAAHIAAMAPGTNLGAATPVQIGAPRSPFPLPRGGDEDAERDGAEKPPAMEEKAVSDAIAYIRSLAQLRGRNVEWAERAVREAASLSAADALEMGVIDLVAESLGVLFERLNGRTVTLADGDRTLETVPMTIHVIEPDWRTELLAVITNPNVALLLMLLGFYGIVLEFYNPGMIFPGVIGAISLLLALYALQVLPVNYVGLALMLLGLGLMLAEVFYPGFGALGLGGVAAFVIGSIMLLETDVPGFGVSRLLIGSIAGISASGFLLLLMFLMRSRRRVPVTGMEEMIGSSGEVIDWTGELGHVRVHGEVWRASADETLAPGAPVRVERIDGLTLVVRPAA